MDFNLGGRLIKQGTRYGYQRAWCVATTNLQNRANELKQIYKIRPKSCQSISNTISIKHRVLTLVCPTIWGRGQSHTHKHTFTHYVQFRDVNYPTRHVSRLREETREPRRNLKVQGEHASSMNKGERKESNPQPRRCEANIITLHINNTNFAKLIGECFY